MGNNAGDGYFLAAYLQQAGYQVTILLPRQVNLQILRRPYKLRVGISLIFIHLSMYPMYMIVMSMRYLVMV